MVSVMHLAYSYTKGLISTISYPSSLLYAGAQGETSLRDAKMDNLRKNISIWATWKAVIFRLINNFVSKGKLDQKRPLLSTKSILIEKLDFHDKLKKVGKRLYAGAQGQNLLLDGKMVIKWNLWLLFAIDNQCKKKNHFEILGKWLVFLSNQ